MSQMEANRAALPKPPAYARGGQTRRGYVFDHLYISPQVHNDVSAMLAAEAKRFLMEKATPKSLFAQLREMGVSCSTCDNCYHMNSYAPDETPRYLCETIDGWNGNEFLCSTWRAK